VLPFYLIFSAAGIYGIVTGARFKKPIFIYGVIVALLVAANFSPLFDILTKPSRTIVLPPDLSKKSLRPTEIR